MHRAPERAGWSIGDLERVEIDETFAAIAIAHGHPIGATGAILTTRLLHSMRRDGLSRGPVTLCIGGGQGIALAFERLRRAPDALS